MSNIKFQSYFFSDMDRTKNLYKNRHLADCKFRFPAGQFLEANKALLSFYSPVFESMFYGGFPEEDFVEIIDADYEIFDKFLMFIYTKKTELVDTSEAESIYYLARKYEVLDLEYDCLKFIRRCLNVDTVCTAFEIARLFDDQDLENVCLDIISSNTSQVLASKSFFECHVTTLTAIMSHKIFNITSEMELFTAIENYSKENDTAIEDIKIAVQKIQFLRMTQEDFVKGPMMSKILTNEEKLAIMSCLTMKDKNDPENYKLPENFTEAVDRIYLDRSDENIFRILNEFRSTLDPPFFKCSHYADASINHIIIKCAEFEERRHDMLTTLGKRELFRFGPDPLYRCLENISYKNGKMDEDSRRLLCDYIRSHNIDIKYLLKLKEEDIAFMLN